MRHVSVPYRAIAVLGLLAVILIACTSKSATPTAVPVVETRIVEMTRQIEVTVVVTATPIPIPAYVSKITAPAGTLTYPLPGDPLTLDPQEAYDPTSLLVAAQLYEGLFNLRADGSTAPAAATGLAASADATVYTVTLRSGLTWSDGRPVIAQHYADGVCRLMDPAVGSPFAYLLTEIAPVQGATAYAAGDLADCAQVGVTAADDLTLRFTLARPVAFFPALLASHPFWPARLDASEATAGTPSPTGSQSAIGNLQSTITNGPYLLAEQPTADRIVLVKNPAYWNAAQVAVERIEFSVVPDPARQTALYEAGALQVAEPPAGEIPRIQADAGFARELHVLAQPGVSYLGLNTQIAPTNDVNVRRAIASALDRRALIGQPWHVAAQTIIPPTIAGYRGAEPVGGLAYDLEAAQQFLVEAGYGSEKLMPPVELWYNREGNNDALFKAVADMLEQAGIPVRLVASGWPYYRDALNACTGGAPAQAGCSYNLYRMGWVMDYADASSMLRVFSPGSGLQYTGWAAEDYDRLLAQAEATSDEATRAELYRQAERLLLDDAVVVPLQYYDRVVLVKDGLTFEYPLFGPPQLQYWRLR